MGGTRSIHLNNAARMAEHSTQVTVPVLEVAGDVVLGPGRERREGEERGAVTCWHHTSEVKQVL